MLDSLGLYIKYPETTLQDMLQHMPQSVASLLRASWALHNVENADFEPAKALALLERCKISEWCSLYPRIIASHDASVEVVEGLIDLYEEVDVAVELYAQCVNAAIETFVNPHVEIRPITLSKTEHLRIATSLWTLKLFYQLQLKFSYHGKVNDFAPIFVRSLYPWQVEQGKSVEQFFQTTGMCFDNLALYWIIDDKYSSPEKLSEKSLYFRNYLRIREQISVYSHPLRSHEVSFSQATRHFNHHGWPTPWGRQQHDYDHLPRPRNDSQLRNHGWLYYEKVLHHINIQSHHYGQFFLELGIFFWDLDRLIDWDLDDPNDFTPTMERLHQRIQEANTICDRVCYGRYAHWRCEEMIAKQLLQWTRCPVQCTVEEWLYQGPALARAAEGRSAIPPMYLTLGVECSICGQPGHRGMSCRVKE